MDRKPYLSDEVVDRRTRPDNGDAPPEAASGGESEIPSEMYTMRLGVTVHPDQDFDEIW